MRRPLFWVALCLVIAALVRLETGACDRTQTGCISTDRLTARETITVTGQIYQKDEESVCLRAVVLNASDSVNSIELNDFSSKIGAFGQSAVNSQREIPIQENLICKLSGAEQLSLGSRVTLSGTFMPFFEASNPGEFSGAEYYRTLRIGGRLLDAQLTASDGGCWLIREKLYDMKKYLKQRLYQAVPEKEAAILSALLLGDKTELDSEVKELYKRNGILHILSISSLHITIIGMSVYKLLRKAGLPVGVAAAAGSILLLLYGGMTGFGVSACRAIGMYLLRMLAEILGRTYDMLIALGLLAAIMVTANPYYLGHSGFLLSFGSVLGIGVVYANLAPQRQGFGQKRSRVQKIWEGFAKAALASLSVTLTTLPIQLWFYYEVPVWSVFLNLLVLPFMKPLMLAGLAAMLLPAGSIWGGAARLILAGYEWLCVEFDKLPFHVWNPGRPRMWQVVAYYGILLGVTVYCRQRHCHGQEPCYGEKRRYKHRPQFMYRSISVAALAIAIVLFAVKPARKNSVTFLDVGQGDCIIVRTASGENYLFDCGSTSRSSVGRYVLLPYLKYCGIRRLDAVFVSHPDADHINGVTELLEMKEENGISICQLVLPAIDEAERETQLKELLQAAGEKTIVRYLAAGDSWKCGSADFWCMHPQANDGADNSNVYSMCVYAEFEEGATMLLTGDVEGEGEQALLEALRRQSVKEITILKVAHHGSRNATSDEFLRQVTPRIALISCGENNRYGHPHEELLERLDDSGAHIVQTPESGAVTVTFSQGGVRLEKYKSKSSTAQTESKFPRS